MVNKLPLKEGRISNDRGSLTLEAAISMTLLLLVGFTLVLLVQFLYVGEVLDQALFETADTAAFAINPLEGVAGQAALKIRLELSLKKNLSQKGMAQINVRLDLKSLSGGAYQMTAVYRQSTPLLGTLVLQKNYHILNAGFFLSQQDQWVWVTDQGGRYHEAGCHTLRKSKTVHTLTLNEAVEKGYTPCKICVGKTLFGKPRDPKDD